MHPHLASPSSFINSLYIPIAYPLPILATLSHNPSLFSSERGGSPTGSPPTLSHPVSCGGRGSWELA